MVNNEIFIIEKLTHDATHITANLIVNKNSPIFNGHFPGQPVVPGACIIQVVKDVLERTLNIKTMLIKASNIKFLSMITPNTGQTPNLTITYKVTDSNSVIVTAQIIAGGVTCFKLQGTYIKL